MFSTWRCWSRTGWLIASGLLVACGLVAFATVFRPAESNAKLLLDGECAFAAGRFDTAHRLAVRALANDRDSKPANMLAARSAAQMRQHETALEFYERIPDDGSRDAIVARCEAGDILLLESKRLSGAAKQFRRALQQDPDCFRANEHLAFALGLASHNWEQIPHRLAVIRLNRFQYIHLYTLSLAKTALENPEILDEYHHAAPNDPLALTGLARVAVEEQRHEEARRLLETVVRSHPVLVEAHVQLGRLSLDKGTEADLLTWHEGLPDGAERHPAIWAVRGGWAARSGQPRAAARCYWEAVRLDPNREEAAYQLGQLLVSLGRPDQAAPFLERARGLQQYLNAVKAAGSGRPGDLESAARQAESLGLLWEAYGWCQLAARQVPGSWTQEILARLGTRLPALPTSARAVSEASPARRIDLSDFPLPDWGTSGRDSSSPSRFEVAASRPRFEDTAATAGLNFTYFNGGDPSTGMKRMYEFTGGGTGVLDYDGDGRPDIYLTQGSRWPVRPDNSEHIDRLFRNRSGERFEDVTERAGIHENGFSQGVTAGDFDSDGFADLYVANIGRNRLYRNNGDGTFSDVTDETGIGDGRWTTSCLIADLNGDSLPDLYDVNYLTGDDVFTRICRERGGHGGICLPHEFPAAQDQFFLNLGDGRFAEATATAGFEVPGGKGLGIVAADFDSSGRLGLFIANDAVPNFYFVPDRVESGIPRFVEKALLSGLALNAEGRNEACMGVAADDADGDGRIDLFVTNFLLESNTLYLQQSAAQFIDATSRSGLRDASLPMLGFGTQFLDADLDGRPDLIVTNGHIDDFRAEGTAFQMPPQYFRNVGGGRFVELPAESLGPFFGGKYLGRGLARLDWNGDGLEDVVVSHLDAPAALLANRTPGAGRSLAVRLVGVDASRDAIGARVTVKTAGGELTRQLTAGDGYQASNQRQLVFGLGTAERVDELSVRWPSGRVQTFTDQPLDTVLLVIEGCSEAIPLARADRSH